MRIVSGVFAGASLVMSLTACESDLHKFERLKYTKEPACSAAVANELQSSRARNRVTDWPEYERAISARNRCEDLKRFMGDDERPR
jgi:hypothetical protein